MRKIQMSRRQFTKASVTGVLAGSLLFASASRAQGKKPLRLGGPISAKDPDSWVKTCKELGYRAAYCPVEADASDDLIRAYRAAADKNDIVIAEVGAWSNPIATNETMRKDAIRKCKTQLALAEQIGANCCVNVAGSRNPDKWAGPHKDNLTRETFEIVVETTRDIIDAVNPTRTYFTLECMPWSFPDSVQSYLRLIEAIDRKAFAVHFDPVNLVVSPRVYFFNGRMIREMFEKVGPHIRSCHAKDITIDEDIYTPHLSECRPGTGSLDYAELLRQLAKQPDTPLMMEHLPTQQEYKLAADYIRSVAAQIGLTFV
ncbi:MAG: sugar phosphate isomerase/epimerase [Sedimentisphaerales bacterium]|nr:sugar phosphate isomerase/epimerase [Sedimentisphaerales bacterium]